MVAANSSFWVAIDEQITASIAEPTAKSEAKVVTLASVTNAHALPQGRESCAAITDVASNWAGVLNTIAAAKSLVEQQNLSMQQQADAHERSIQDLREELRQIREEVLASEAHARDVELRSATKIKEILAQAEARVQEIEEGATERVTAAESRLHVALQRAETAERWLRQIELAAEGLLTSGRSAATPLT